MDTSALDKELQRSAKKLRTVRTREELLWNEHVTLVKAAVESGMSMPHVAKMTGVTKARVWQIVNDHKGKPNA